MNINIKEINKKLNNISYMVEAINLDSTVRNNLKEENPSLYFVREDLELTLMREDMLLEKLKAVEEEYSGLGIKDARIENKIKLTRQSILRIKSQDMGLLSFMDNNIKTQLSISKMLKEVEGERDSKDGGAD